MLLPPRLIHCTSFRFVLCSGSRNAYNGRTERVVDRASSQPCRHPYVDAWASPLQSFAVPFGAATRRIRLTSGGHDVYDRFRAADATSGSR